MIKKTQNKQVFLDKRLFVNEYHEVLLPGFLTPASCSSRSLPSTPASVCSLELRFPIGSVKCELGYYLLVSTSSLGLERYTVIVTPSYRTHQTAHLIQYKKNNHFSLKSDTKKSDKMFVCKMYISVVVCMCVCVSEKEVAVGHFLVSHLTEERI